MKSHLKTLLTIILLSIGAMGLCQQGYTYELDEDWVYEQSIYKDVIKLMLIENDDVLISANWHWNFNFFGIRKLFSNGVMDNSFGFTSTASNSGGPFHRVNDGYLIFVNQTVGKLNLNGQQPFPNFHYAYGGFPYQPADDRAVLPLPDGRFYVSGRMYVSATESMQRHLVRMMPDGSVDTTFTQRVVGSPSSAITWTMTYYDETRIMVGGNFGTFEGHYTPNMARVFLDGSVDTTFTSPLLQRWISKPAHIDEAGRVYVTNPLGGLESYPPEDTLNLIRLMPNGSVDTTFHLPHFGGLHAPSGYAGVGIYGLLPEDDGGYIVYGVFSSVDGHPRNCIAKIDSSGYLVEDIFDDLPVFQLFNDSASWALSWDYVQVRHIIRMPDGGILAGGLFTHFNGVERWNLVKLKKVLITDVGVSEQTKNTLGVFPNPATNSITITGFTAATQSTINMYNMSGQQVLQQNVPAGSGSFSVQVQELPSGIYVIQLHSSGNTPMFGKVVIQR